MNSVSNNERNYLINCEKSLTKGINPSFLEILPHRCCSHQNEHVLYLLSLFLRRGDGKGATVKKRKK